MTHKAKLPALKRSEWFFGEYKQEKKGKRDERKAAECLACCYYEYARSCPLMIQRIKDAEGIVDLYALEHPAPRYAYAFTGRFPETPWLDIPQKERTRIVESFKPETVKRELIYVRERQDWNENEPWKPEFKEYGPYLLKLGGSTIVTFNINWERGNDDLEKAFRQFLRDHRPDGSGPKRGRVNSPLDRLNALGAHRMIKHCGLTRGEATPQAAFEQMCRQLAWAEKEDQKPYAEAGPLENAAGRVQDYLLNLFLVAETRPTKRNDEEFEPLYAPAFLGTICPPPSWIEDKNVGEFRLRDRLRESDKMRRYEDRTKSLGRNSPTRSIQASRCMPVPWRPFTGYGEEAGDAWLVEA